jgi:hypothetical protein
MTFLSLTACGEEEAPNFEVNEQIMQDYTKQIIEQYRDVSDVEKEYYLNDGTELEQTAIKGFDAAQTTDHVGKFMNYVEGDNATDIYNGVDGKVVFSQLCK